ncbi:MAG TPA: heme-binding domain-containing protein [Blastocatellia bacterium]|nr:heme-binding domain-containing protein [Blastocatellia bacterium]
MVKKISKWAGIVLAVAFVVIQFVRPAKTNPPVDDSATLSARLQVTPEVEAILNRSCIDCHSHKTVWPWYSHVAPVSWLLVHDVNEGRRHWNVSNWPTDPKRSARRLDELCEQVEKGEMPLAIYVTMHPTAKLSDTDKKTLCDWAKAERQRIGAVAPQGSAENQGGERRPESH